MSQVLNDNVHWADLAADKIIRGNNDKESYTLASGNTPFFFHQDQRMTFHR